MKRGVIYFNMGTKCLLRTVVSIHSLRKHYSGPITVISNGPESNELCQKLFEDSDINVVIAEFDKDIEGKNNVFLKKASVNDFTPYDISVFLDADTLVRGKIDELFDLAERSGFVVPQFTNWTTETRCIIKRIKGWSDCHPDLIERALLPAPAVNCGVFAFVKDTPFIVDWRKNIEGGRDQFIPDETGMQVVLHKYPHFVCDQKYNVSCKYSKPHHSDTRIIHYHGRKHCRLDDKGTMLYGSDLWIEEYNECLKEKPYNWPIVNKHKDKMLKRFLSFKIKPKIVDKRVTIVTAVNPPYLDKLKMTLPTWQLKPQLRDCPIVVFHNGFKNPEKELSFIKTVSKRDVKLVEWNMPNAESARELMLSAFVIGAPKEVETPYWLKMDADAYFTDSQDCILPHFYDYDLSGHKWRYTKSPTGESWIDRLDLWSEDKDIDGDIYLNEEERIKSYKHRRYGHKRIASFVCLHKTEFSREAAEYIDDKLPVPSHDTYMWYIANRLPDRKWCWHNFKKLGVRNHTDINKLKELTDEVQQRITTEEI